MTYDLSGSFSLNHLARAAQGVNYTFKIKTEAPLETVIKLMEAADKGCHTINSMRKRMMVAGKFLSTTSNIKSAIERELLWRS